MGKRLVRDRALETWTVPGAEHQVRPVKDVAEHRTLLVSKLMEEAVEVITADGPQEQIKELADLLAVMHAYASANDIDWTAVTLALRRRYALSGGFEQGMVWETPR